MRRRSLSLPAGRQRNTCLPLPDVPEGERGPFMASVLSAGFTVTNGRLSTFKSSEIAERGFCAACGTPLTYRSLVADVLIVTLGSLDHRPTGTVAACVIRCATALPLPPWSMTANPSPTCRRFPARRWLSRRRKT